MKHVLVALLLVGCGGAPVRVSLAPPDRTFKAAEYVDLLKKWTRHGHLRDDFDAALDVSATLRSPEFRAVYAEKWITVFRVGAEDAARLRNEIQAEGGDTWEFHVEAATHRYETSDLSSRKSIWRIALVDDQGREEVVKDVIGSRDKRELEMAFYPYAGIFTRGWTLRFPRTRADGTPMVGPDTKTLTLRFAGPQGSVDLVWCLR
jgi:hypothetical protein